MAPQRGVLSPVDVAELHEGWSGQLAGRVHAADGATVLLADAFCAVRVKLSCETSVEPGSFAVVKAEKRLGELVDGAVCAVQRVAASSSAEHDRLLRDGVGRNLAARARALSLVRAWFASEGFVEVDTPVRVPSPGLDLHLDAFRSEEAFLITSPEYQMKRLVAGGMPRIFQLVHCLRRGELGPWHNPEFLMLEWYRAFAGFEQVMQDTEQLVAHVASGMLGRPLLEMQGRQLELTPPFERMTVCEAFETYASVSEEHVVQWASHDEDTYFRVLVEAVEPALAQRPRPVFLTRYPAQQASLARLCPDDPRFCERFELYVGGHELCNGFGELVDPAEQRQRLQRDVAHRSARSLAAYPIDEAFLAALQGGMPASGGNALGMDRLIALMAGADAIESVLAFPHRWLAGQSS
jgi:lysyl-tRNA synthetase class 2